MNLMKLNEKHVKEISDIHLTSWSKNEISVILGKRYVNSFYRSIAESSLAFGYIYEINNRIIAYATGFWDYYRFFDEFKKSNSYVITKLLFIRIITRKLRLKEIYNMYFDNLNYKHLKYFKYHLNSLALRNEYKSTPLGREAILSVIENVINTFKNGGAEGCWGRTDFRNKRMCSYYMKLGFTQVKNEEKNRSRYLIFEKKFKI